MPYFCGLISPSSDEVRAVSGELDIVDLLVELVRLDILQLISSLSVPVLVSIFPNT